MTENSSFNESSVENGQSDNQQNYSSLIMAVCLVGMPGLTANSLAFYCIIPDIKKKKSLVKQLLLALCIADFFGCLGAVQLQIVTVFPNSVPRSVCALSSFFTVYFPMLSGAIATFMACERCVALRTPYWYQENMSSWKFWAPFFITVMLITVVCLFPVVGLGDVVRHVVQNGKTIVVCGSFPTGQTKTLKESVFALSYGVLGLVMVAVNVSLNAAVLQVLNRMKRRVKPSMRNKKDTSQEFEMTKMLLVLSLTFLICWVPLNMQLLLIQLGVPQYKPVHIFIMALVGLNFAVDPLIYLIMKRKYREEMRRLLCCHRDDEDDNTTMVRLTTLSSNTQDIVHTADRNGCQYHI